MRPLGLLRTPQSPDEVIGQDVGDFIMATPIGTRFAAAFPKDIDCEEVHVLTELPEPIPQWDNAG